MKKKILGHIVAIGSFLLGGVFTHQAYNARCTFRWSEKAKAYVVERYMEFFNLKIPTTVIFDTGLVLMGTAFFIEFWKSFKPLEYKEKKE